MRDSENMTDKSVRVKKVGRTKINDYISARFSESFCSKLLLGYDKISNLFLNCALYVLISRLIDAFSGLKTVRRRFSRSCENSRIVSFFKTLSKKSLEKTLRYYGAAMFFFGIFVVAFSALREVTLMNRIPFYQIHIGDTVLLGTISVLLSVLLMSSHKSLAVQICDSKILSLLLFELLSFDKKEFQRISPAQRSYTFPVIIGMVAAIIVTFTSVAGFIGTVAVLSLILAVMRSPESGVICVILLLPFLPGDALVFTVSLVCISFIFKCLRNKRLIRIGFIDILFVLLALCILLSGIITISSDTALGNSLIYIEFIFFGFVIVNCIKTSALVKKCIFALLVSASFVSFTGVAVYFIDFYKLSEISFVFESLREIFLLVPFSASSYYIELVALVAPIAFANLFGKSINTRKRHSFVPFVLIYLNIALSFDFSLWIMAVCSILFYTVVLHPKFIYTLVTASLTLCAFRLALPSVFTGIFRFVNSHTSFDALYHEFLKMENFALQLCTKYNFAGLSTGDGAIERASAEMFGVATAGMFSRCSAVVKVLLSLGLPGAVVIGLIFLFYSSFTFSFIFGKTGRNSYLRKFVAVIFSSLSAMALRGIFFPAVLSSQAVLGLVILCYIGIAARNCAESEYVPELYERQFFDSGTYAGGV